MCLVHCSLLLLLLLLLRRARDLVVWRDYLRMRAMCSY